MTFCIHAKTCVLYLGMTAVIIAFHPERGQILKKNQLPSVTFKTQTARL